MKTVALPNDGFIKNQVIPYVYLPVTVAVLARTPRAFSAAVAASEIYEVTFSFWGSMPESLAQILGHAVPTGYATERINPIRPVRIPKKEVEMNKEWFFRRAPQAIATVIAMILGMVWAYLWLNVAESPNSYLIATGLAAWAAIVVAGLLLASSTKTGLFGGFGIGLTILVSSVALFGFWKPFDTLDWGSLVLGVCGLLLVVVSITLVFITASATHHTKAEAASQPAQMPIPAPAAPAI